MKLITIGNANGYLYQAREHTHPYDEIILTLSGSGTTKVGEERGMFRAGTIECVPAGISHAKYAQERFRDIFIGAEDIAVLREGKPLLVEDDRNKTVETLMRMALQAHHKATQAEFARELAAAICEYLRSMSVRTGFDDEVEQFKNHIIENYTDPDFTIGAAEEKFGYCTDHLRRKFRKETGMTPIAYLNHLRLEYACRFVRENRDDMPVANLALMSGYYDAHYFARLFKAYTGMTPSEFLCRCKSEGK